MREQEGPMMFKATQQLNFLDLISKSHKPMNLGLEPLINSYNIP